MARTSMLTEESESPSEMISPSVRPRKVNSTGAASLMAIDAPVRSASSVWRVPDLIDTGLGCQFGEFPES
jgi:hypothetical protein